MSLIVTWMDQFDYLIESMADEEATNWPLMKSPSRIILILLAYIFLVTSIGPKFMKQRKPFNLKRIIIVYNTFQVIVCATLCIWVFESNPSFGCVPLENLSREHRRLSARIIWWTTLLKFADLIETVFFVLRKKQNQVSALHVYHHVSTLVIVWGSVKLFPSTMVLLPIMINTMVHTIMYTYYLLSAIGSDVQENIRRFKKYITIIQMVQFGILVMYATQILLPYCKVPNAYAYIFIPNVFLVFYMFYQFYQNAYQNRIKKLE